MLTSEIVPRVNMSDHLAVLPCCWAENFSGSVKSKLSAILVIFVPSVRTDLNVYIGREPSLESSPARYKISLLLAELGLRVIRGDFSDSKRSGLVSYHVNERYIISVGRHAI